MCYALKLLQDNIHMGSVGINSFICTYCCAHECNRKTHDMVTSKTKKKKRKAICSLIIINEIHER